MSLARSNRPAHRPRIVFIDDSKLWQTVMLDLLDSLCHFKVYDSWSAAFPCLTSEDIDVLILDVQLPGFQGPSIASMLRRSQNIKKIVLFSSLNAQELAAEVAQCGADGYLQKAQPKSMILAQLKTILDDLDRALMLAPAS